MVPEHEPLQYFFKQQDLNKCQIWCLQKFFDTPISIVYWPEKQATVPDALYCSPIHQDSMDESANSQLFDFGYKFFCPICGKQHTENDQDACNASKQS